jgi:hypothetical protein
VTCWTVTVPLGRLGGYDGGVASAVCLSSVFGPSGFFSTGAAAAAAPLDWPGDAAAAALVGLPVAAAASAGLPIAAAAPPGLLVCAGFAAAPAAAPAAAAVFVAGCLLPYPCSASEGATFLVCSANAQR